MSVSFYVAECSPNLLLQFVTAETREKYLKKKIVFVYKNKNT
jgi:hypothetical protein